MRIRSYKFEWPAETVPPFSFSVVRPGARLPNAAEVEHVVIVPVAAAHVLPVLVRGHCCPAQTWNQDCSHRARGMGALARPGRCYQVAMVALAVHLVLPPCQAACCLRACPH